MSKYTFKLKNPTYDVDYNDLEEIILKTYGHMYEIMPMEEVGSSQYAATYEVGASKGELTECEEKHITLLSVGKPEQYILSTILTDLCNKDIIPEGNYCIKVNW